MNNRAENLFVSIFSHCHTSNQQRFLGKIKEIFLVIAIHPIKGDWGDAMRACSTQRFCDFKPLCLAYQHMYNHMGEKGFHILHLGVCICVLEKLYRVHECELYKNLRKEEFCVSCHRPIQMVFYPGALNDLDRGCPKKGDNRILRTLSRNK